MGLRKPRKTHGFLSMGLRKSRKTALGNHVKHAAQTAADRDRQAQTPTDSHRQPQTLTDTHRQPPEAI